MKKLKYLLVILCLVLSVASYAQDEDLEALLMEDDTMLEQELLGETEKVGDVMSGLVKQLIGQAVLKEESQAVWKQVFMGMDINEGSTIVTMEKSEVKVELENGAIVDIRPRTQAYFETLRKNPEKQELTETGIQLFMGKIYSNVKKLVDTGSRYEVNTGTATAGVRGTKFISEKKETGEESCLTIEGQVEFYKNDDPAGAVMLGAGQKASVDKDGNINQGTHEEKAPEDIEEEKAVEEEKLEEEAPEEIKEATEEVKEKEAPKSMEGDSSTGTGNISMESGYEEIDGVGYAQLEINPDFHNIFGTPIGLGLKFSIQQGQNDEGETKTTYGPSADNELAKIVSIRWAEFNSKILGLKYGELGGTTYGHGLLMDAYDTFGMKLRISPESTRIKAMVPLKEGSGSEADQVAAGRIEQRIYKKVYVGATYLMDMEDDIDTKLMPESGVAGDLFIELSDLFTPYAEYASLTDFGTAFSVGVKGKKGILNYKAEYRNIGEEFVPGYYNNFYEETKDNGEAGIVEDSDGYSGYVAGLGIDIRIARLSAQYELYEDTENLTGKVVIPEMKFMPGMWSRLQAGVDYKEINLSAEDHTFKNEAEYRAYFMYPASQSVDIMVEQIKEPGEDAYQSFKTIVRF